MSLRIRRGTNQQRKPVQGEPNSGILFDLGEIVYTTDTKKLYIGDGVTHGGNHILETSVGNGFTFNPTTQQIDFSIGNLNLNTSQVTEDASRLYYTNERAQDTVAAALVAGNAFNTGVTFTYDDANNRITAVSTGGAVLNVSADTSPQLGGDLNTGIFNISGSGSITAGTITANTGLGANLSLNGKTINGTGSINIAGSITSTSVNPERIVMTGAGTISSAYSSMVLATSDPLVPVAVKGITTGSPGGTPYLTLQMSKGTISAPTNTSAGNILGGMYVQGYYNGDFKPAGGFGAMWKSSAVMTDDTPASDILFITNKGGSAVNFFVLKGDGTLSAPVLQASATNVMNGNAVPFANATERDAQITNPKVGMICYVEDNGTGLPRFQGYISNTGSSSPGWVDLH